jgi:hypothetical protein
MHRKFPLERWLFMLATCEGGFHQVATLASKKKPPVPRGVPGKLLILSHNAEAVRGGGFQVASPVKKPRASEMPRCAPPYKDPAREEPWPGGGMFGPKPPLADPADAAPQLSLCSHSCIALHFRWVKNSGEDIYSLCRRSYFKCKRPSCAQCRNFDGAMNLLKLAICSRQNTACNSTLA